MAAAANEGGLRPGALDNEGSELVFLLLVAVVAALMLGFAGGMVTYQKSRRWCTWCGLTLTCQVCQPVSGQRAEVER